MSKEQYSCGIAMGHAFLVQAIILAFFIMIMGNTNVEMVTL